MVADSYTLLPAKVARNVVTPLVRYVILPLLSILATLVSVDRNVTAKLFGLLNVG